MAIVDDDEIEELGAEFPEYFFTICADKLLVEREINFVCWVELAMFDLCDYFTQRFEVSVYCLIDENISISKIENLPCHACLA